MYHPTEERAWSILKFLKCLGPGSCPINTLFEPNILDDWCPKCPVRVPCHEILGEQQVEGHFRLLLTISLSGMHGLTSFDQLMEHDGGWNCTLPPSSPKLAFEDLKLTMCFSTCSEPTPEKKNNQKTHPAKSRSRTIPMKRDIRYINHCTTLWKDAGSTPDVLCCVIVVFLFLGFLGPGASRWWVGWLNQKVS